MKAKAFFYLLSSVALAGCATTRGTITSQENLLSAAGFDVKPANTARRQDALKQLPSNRFVMHAKGDHVVYVYADPVVCDCLYVGDQKAYNAYQREEFQRDIANQQQLTAQMYQGDWDWRGWNWGPWGWGRRFAWW